MEREKIEGECTEPKLEADSERKEEDVKTGEGDDDDLDERTKEGRSSNNNNNTCDKEKNNAKTEREKMERKDAESKKYFCADSLKSVCQALANNLDLLTSTGSSKLKPEVAIVRNDVKNLRRFSHQVETLNLFTLTLFLKWTNLGLFFLFSLFLSSSVNSRFVHYAQVP